MRRQVILLGVFALGTGVAMAVMLGQLRSDFFRAYLPPWVYVSYAVSATGAAAIVAGALMKPVGESSTEAGRAGGAVARIALLNAVISALMLIPVLVPSYRLPILITQWPGVYMVLAYFSFLVVGVLGMAAWSVFLLHLPGLLGRTNLSTLWFRAQLALTEVGVYVLAVAMFAGGYVGSWLAYTGAGPAVVGAEMEFSVIPSAVGIFMVAAGTFMGVLNVVLAGRSVKT